MKLFLTFVCSFFSPPHNAWWTIANQLPPWIASKRSKFIWHIFMIVSWLFVFLCSIQAPLSSSSLLHPPPPSLMPSPSIESCTRPMSRPMRCYCALI
jgi:hypothetical protein